MTRRPNDLFDLEETPPEAIARAPRRHLTGPGAKRITATLSAVEATADMRIAPATEACESLSFEAAYSAPRAVPAPVIVLESDEYDDVETMLGLHGRSARLGWRGWWTDRHWPTPLTDEQAAAWCLYGKDP